MEKLLELEKKLKEYREELEKMSTPINEDGEEINKDETSNTEEISLEKNGQWSLEKGLGKDLNSNESKERVKHVLGSIRQPAKVTDSEGNEEIVSPAKQVSDKVSAAAQRKEASKAKAEEAAAARRSSYKKQGLMKNNQQWTLEE